MGLRKLIKRYKVYEAKTLAERAAKKKRLIPYRELASKKTPVKKPKRKFSTRKFTEAMGNPYNTKFPKIIKKLKRVKKRKRRKVKTVIIYR